MARNRFVKPGIIRIDLTDGDWIDVKQELTVGEARDLLFGTMIEQPDGTYKRDLDRSHMARLLAYLVNWSFLDEGARVPISPDAINGLDLTTLAELIAAINSHEERGRTKNAPGATPNG